jgi:hypothetical protein
MSRFRTATYTVQSEAAEKAAEKAAAEKAAAEKAAAERAAAERAAAERADAEREDAERASAKLAATVKLERAKTKIKELTATKSVPELLKEAIGKEKKREDLKIKNIEDRFNPLGVHWLRDVEKSERPHGLPGNEEPFNILHLRLYEEITKMEEEELDQIISGCNFTMSIDKPVDNRKLNIKCNVLTPEPRFTKQQNAFRNLYIQYLDFYTQKQRDIEKYTVKINDITTNFIVDRKLPKEITRVRKIVYEPFEFNQDSFLYTYFIFKLYEKKIDIDNCKCIMTTVDYKNPEENNAYFSFEFLDKKISQTIYKEECGKLLGTNGRVYNFLCDDKTYGRKRSKKGRKHAKKHTKALKAKALKAMGKATKAKVNKGKKPRSKRGKKNKKK